jgi:hypothetical protein
MAAGPTCPTARRCSERRCTDKPPASPFSRQPPGRPSWPASSRYAAFRVLPSWPVFSRRFGEFGQGRLPVGPEKVLSWAERYLERLPRGRTVLFKWASVMASNFRDPDDTLRGFAAEIGMSWSAFQRTHRRACEIIAKGLARDGVSTFHL